MHVKVLIPKHCSSLNDLRKVPLHYQHEDVLEIEKDTDMGVEEICQRQKQRQNDNIILLVHVHREKAVWNFFAPVFSFDDKLGNTLSTKIAAESLLHSMMDLLKEKSMLKWYIHGSSKRFYVVDNSIHNNSDDMNWTQSNFLIKTFTNEKKRKRKNAVNGYYEGEKTKSRSLVIYILPPTVCTSLNPERIFTSSLVKLENLQIKLQSLNAYIATLGGGYFLCHYLSTAVCLARYQRKIALQLNDVNLALKCTINESYNFIYAGLIPIALKLIDQTEKLALMRKTQRTKCSISVTSDDEDVILSMCKAARWFAGCVQNGINGQNKENKRLLMDNFSDKSVTNDLKGNGATGSSRGKKVTSTHDDYQRIRIVQIRTISPDRTII